MGVFETLLKINHTTKNPQIEPDSGTKKKKIMDYIYFYWDIEKNQFFSIKDVTTKFLPYAKTDRRIRQSIMGFFGFENKVQASELLDIIINESKIPDKYFNQPSGVLGRSIPYVELKDQILSSPYESSSESYSEVFVLTKEICWTLFYSDFPLPKGITISYMRYKNNWRFSTTRKRFISKDDPEIDLLQIEFELNNSRLACMCFSRNYLTILKFIGIPTILQESLLSIFRRFEIIAVTKKDIRVKFLPKPSISKSLIIPLRDVLMTSEVSKFIVTMEQDKPLENKKRSSFMIGGVKITIPKSDSNDEIFFRVFEKISFLDALYFNFFFTKLIAEFHARKLDIIASYQHNIKGLVIEDTKRVKKTKKLIEGLRQAEPTIFGDVYTQDCQYKRQPYIVEPDEFDEKLREVFGGDEEIETFLDKKTSDLNREVTTKDLLLEFPNEEFREFYPKASIRYYACVGRTNIPNDTYPFPLVQKKVTEPSLFSSKTSQNIEEFLTKRDTSNIEVRGAPCCYQKLHIEEKATTGGKTHSLTSMKNVPPERKGEVQNYLASFTKDYYRYGIETFENLLTRPTGRDVLEFDTSLTDENLNVWSFHLDTNIVLYETLYIYNTLIFKLIPSFIDEKVNKFIFFTKNTSGTYEIIKAKDKSIFDNTDVISSYALTFFKILDNEKLERKN
jgi:hypothetical protein